MANYTELSHLFRDLLDQEQESSELMYGVFKYHFLNKPYVLQHIRHIVVRQ